MLRWRRRDVTGRWREAQVLAGITELDWYCIGQIAAEVHDIGRRLAEILRDLEAFGIAR